MNRKYAIRCVVTMLLVSVVCFAAASASRRVTPGDAAPAQFELLKMRFTTLAGRAWFSCEEFADNVGSRFAALRGQLLPGTGYEPLSPPSGEDSAHLKEEAAPR